MLYPEGTVVFEKPVRLGYFGRNGYGICSGVYVEKRRDVTFVAAVNSKGDIAGASMEIPNESVGAVCMALRADLFGLVLSRLDRAGNLPLLLGMDAGLDREIEPFLKKIQVKD